MKKMQVIFDGWGWEQIWLRQDKNKPFRILIFFPYFSWIVFYCWFLSHFVGLEIIWGILSQPPSSLHSPQALSQMMELSWQEESFSFYTLNSQRSGGEEIRVPEPPPPHHFLLHSFHLSPASITPSVWCLFLLSFSCPCLLLGPFPTPFPYSTSPPFNCYFILCPFTSFQSIPLLFPLKFLSAAVHLLPLALLLPLIALLYTVHPFSLPLPFLLPLTYFCPFPSMTFRFFCPFPCLTLPFFYPFPSTFLCPFLLLHPSFSFAPLPSCTILPTDTHEISQVTYAKSCLLSNTNHSLICVNYDLCVTSYLVRVSTLIWPKSWPELLRHTGLICGIVDQCYYTQPCFTVVCLSQFYIHRPAQGNARQNG